MAVQQWELEQVRAVPSLELVPVSPRGGRVVPAILFVTLLIGVLAYPGIQAIGEPGPRAMYETPRRLPASQLMGLDQFGDLGGSDRPMSSEPLGGILFVSCTNLWTALPDGSHARKLLAFPGISSPTFSPDARTIAFAGPGDQGPALFMVAADGSELTEMGTLKSDGVAVGARVSNLSWSPRADRLVFALVDPAYSPWAEGATIWTLDLASGAFNKVGGGSPSPVFAGRGVAFSDRLPSNAEVRGAQFVSPNRSTRYLTRNISTPEDDLTFGVMPDGFSDAWATKHGLVVLRARSDGTLELATKSDAWSRKVNATYTAPSPYAFLPTGRVSMAQDGRRAIADLVDPKGDRAMGILDLTSGRWAVRDYAWSGIATPAPTYSGPVGAERARRLAEDFFGSRRGWGTYKAAALLVGDEDDDLLDGSRAGFILGTPERSRSGWSVPATLYARVDKRYGFQHAVFEMTKTDDGRIEGEAHPISPTYPLRTIEDAKRFLSEVVGSEIAFVWPTYLPPGVELDPRWPVDAYSYGGTRTASVHLRLPQVDGERFERSMSLSYGDVHFGLGCGGEVDPEETTVGEEPGLFDQTGNGPRHTRQILWPGTLTERDVGTYSVYGQLPRAELERIAGSMATQD